MPSLRRILTFNSVLTLFIMCVSAIVFFFSSFNLLATFKANFNVILEHGSVVLFDGALQQFFELCGYALISVCAYVIIKACEKVLVDRVLK